MNTVNNCPHCGAAITTEKCPYCGTLFYDFAAIDTEKPFYIKIKRGNRVYRAKVLLSNCTVNTSCSDTRYYFDDQPFILCHPSETIITTEFRVIPDENILGIGVDLDEIEPGVQAW